MLKRCCLPGQKLAVGKPEYKTIIEASFGIACLYDEAVMELMWVLKNLMRSFVPKEKSELTKEERLQMSQGLNILLNRYGFDVKPEMVNDRIIEAACWLYDCDYCERIHSKSLRRIGKHLKDISNIDTRDWDSVEFATALMMLCPTIDYTIGDYQKMFSIAELSKLVADKHKYVAMFFSSNLWVDFEELVRAHEIKIVKQRLLGSLVKEAKEAYEAERVL